MSGEVTDRIAKSNDASNDAQMALIHEYAQTALKAMPNNASENGHGIFYTKQDLQSLQSNPQDSKAAGYLLKNFNAVANLYNDQNQGFWNPYSVNQYGISNNDLQRLSVGSDTSVIGHGPYANGTANSDMWHDAIWGGLGGTFAGAIGFGLFGGLEAGPGLLATGATAVAGALLGGFLGHHFGYQSGSNYERSLNSRIKSFAS